MNTLLQIKKINLWRNNKPILRQYSLDLLQGQAIYLIGDNGSGKSTLLQAIAGLYPIQSGQIIRHQSILYLGHKNGLKNQLTVAENLTILEKIHNNQTIDQKKLDFALNELGLLAKKNQPICQLSAGMTRKTQLARLWLNPAKIWLLDEPLTALDKSSCQKIEDCCNNHLKNNGCLIITSHQAFDFKNNNHQTLQL